jgi:hypothetical protein
VDGVCADRGRVLRAANIMIPSVNSDEAYLRTIVSGAIDDYGPAVRNYPHRPGYRRPSGFRFESPGRNLAGGNDPRSCYTSGVIIR